VRPFSKHPKTNFEYQDHDQNRRNNQTASGKARNLTFAFCSHPGAPGMESRPPTTHPTIKMQNKPNLQEAKINLTSYRNTDYENIRFPRPRKNKPNFEPACKHRMHPQWQSQDFYVAFWAFIGS